MLQEGARVIILDNSRSYGGAFAGKTGTIVHPGYRTENGEYVMGVKIDGKINFSSSYKAFWFATDELREPDNNNTLLTERHDRIEKRRLSKLNSIKRLKSFRILQCMKCLLKRMMT